MEYIALALIFGTVFGIFDAIWLKSAMPLYKKEMGGLLLEKPNMVAAIIFYVIYVLGVAYFILLPAENWVSALLPGMLFGLVAYATYDLTNLATLKNWSKKLVGIDLLWGTFATGVGAVLAYALASWWNVV